MPSASTRSWELLQFPQFWQLICSCGGHMSLPDIMTSWHLDLMTSNKKMARWACHSLLEALRKAAFHALEAAHVHMSLGILPQKRTWELHHHHHHHHHHHRHRHRHRHHHHTCLPPCPFLGHVHYKAFRHHLTVSRVTFSYVNGRSQVHQKHPKTTLPAKQVRNQPNPRCLPEFSE